MATSVLKTLCAGPFREVVTGLIELPDDEPQSFGILLETLYKSCDSLDILQRIYHDIISLENDEHATKLADVYIMADKY